MYAYFFIQTINIVLFWLTVASVTTYINMQCRYRQQAYCIQWHPCQLQQGVVDLCLRTQWSPWLLPGRSKAFQINVLNGAPPRPSCCIYSLQGGPKIDFRAAVAFSRVKEAEI